MHYTQFIKVPTYQVSKVDMYIRSTRFSVCPSLSEPAYIHPPQTNTHTYKVRYLEKIRFLRSLTYYSTLYFVLLRA